MSAPSANPASAVNGQQISGNKRGRDFAYQEPSSGQNSGVMPNYMGYFPPGVPVPQSMYQQMPPSSDVPVMALPPLYVGPPMTMTVHGNQPVPEQSNTAEGTPSKKKHTSQWALEKRRARNRVTAAESRRKSKVEAHALREDVNRINRDLKAKTDLLGEYKDKFAMYESGRSKAEVDRVISQRRSEAAAAAAAAEIVPLSMIASVPVIEVPLGGETARL